MSAESPSPKWRNFAGRTRASAWFLARTNSRQEKILAGELARLGIDAYLPLLTATRRYGGRAVQVESPLFPGILFVCGTEDDARAALSTGRVRGIQRVAEQETLELELEGISRALASGVTPVIRQQPKDCLPVRIRSGAMRGVRGFVDRVRRVSTVFLAVRSLGEFAAFEIDGALVEPLEEHAAPAV